jgi:uncharacterized membrane protein YkvI
VTATVVAAVVGGVVLTMALAFFRAALKYFKGYVENASFPSSASVMEQLSEVRDLSARAVVTAARAEATARRCEEKLTLLLIANENDR